MIKYWHRLENLLAFVFIFLLALFPTMEVIARKFFHTGVRYSTEYTHHLVLILTFIGGMITSRQGKHLSLTLDLKLPEHVKLPIQIFISILTSGLCLAFAWSSLSFALTGFETGQKVGIFPIPIIVLIMFVGYGFMAIRFILLLPKKGMARPLACIGILFGTLLALPTLINTLGTLVERLPDFTSSLLQFSQSFNASVTLPLIILLIGSAVFGTPIFIILGGIAFLLFARTGQPLEVIPNEAYAMLTSHSIPAIPLFTFTGFILSESKAGERLIKLFKSIFSWFPGGLAIMAILVCAFFTTFTGASGVTILALGGLLFIVLKAGNYKDTFSSGLLTASGSIGLLFPPSLPIIVYGVTAQINIKDLFLGGIIPGTVMVLAMIIMGIVYASKKGVDREPFNLKEALSALRESIWEVLLPIVIFVSYFGGLTTLVESGAIAVLYALLVEVVIHRDLKIRDLPNVMLKCIPIIGGVLTILALANGFSYYLIDAEIPMKLAAWVQSFTSSKYVFLLFLNIALLITGCLMDIFSAILVVVPLILPLGQIFGIHPVHLGIIFLANMELGYLTPPVGLNLYLASYRFNQPIAKIYRDVWPFLLLQLTTVLMITYLPFLSTGLLNLVK